MLTYDSYLKREHSVKRRISLIDEVTVWSYHTTPNGRPPPLKPEKRVHHSLQAQERRIRRACAMLPKRLKPYRKVLWSIWRNNANHHKVMAESGYQKSQYYMVLTLLLDFFIPKTRLFMRMRW